MFYFVKHWGGIQIVNESWIPAGVYPPIYRRGNDKGDWISWFPGNYKWEKAVIPRDIGVSRLLILDSCFHRNDNNGLDSCSPFSRGFGSGAIPIRGGSASGMISYGSCSGAIFPPMSPFSRGHWGTIAHTKRRRPNILIVFNNLFYCRTGND